MEIVMIKKNGCMPCKKFMPIVKEYAKKNNLNFRTVQMEDMPENIRPSFYPYFYLRSGDNVIADWGGTNERKMHSILKRSLQK